MSNGWGRGPGRDSEPRGTSKVVPREAFIRHEIKVREAPNPNTKPERPHGSRGAVDMICLPSRLTRLQRSPEHKIHLSQVWTTGLNGRSMYEGNASPTGIILTDVAINRPPDLIFETAVDVSENSGSTILSAQNLQTERSGVPFRPNLKCSHIPEPSQRSFLSRIISRLRSGLFCWRSPQRETAKEEEENHSSSESSKANKPVLKKLQFNEAISCTDLPTLRKQEARRSFQEGRLKAQIHSLKAENRVRASCSLLDLQRERDKAELSPSRYIEDIAVFHNIRRREIIAKALYRESGQLFARLGRPGDANPPLPPFMLLSGASPLPPIKRNFESDPSMTEESRRKILSKIIRLRPHLESVSTGEEKDPVWEQCNFAQDCLRAHNLYRARHLAAPLLLSKKLCNIAQTWANQLAQTGILRHKGDPRYGENIFCRNIALEVRSRQVLPDITGEEVAAYWYSNVRQYRFNLSDTALHAHAGSYSQMVWKDSKKFGVGKALSRSGKLIVVAHYYPPGNVTNNFRDNVLPLSTRALAAEMLCQGQALLEEALAEPEEENTLHKALMNINFGVTGVLAAQPPNIKGINATKILAAHMLGHAATVVTTPDEKLEVVVVSRRSLKRTKSKIMKESQETSMKSTGSSPLNSLSNKKKVNDQNLQYVEKALKEVLNMQLKKQTESFSAPDISSNPGSGRRPKLGEGKRVKFKSEENINIRDRSKAVQTSFSSENLSTEEANIDFSTRVSSPSQESEETLSWSETISSGVPSSYVTKDRIGNSTESISSLSDTSQTIESTSYSKNNSYIQRSSNQETESTSYLTSLSPIQSEEASSSRAPLSSGEFTPTRNNFSRSSSREINATQSSSNETNHDLVYTPKMCSIRRYPVSDSSYLGSLDSLGSISSRVSPTADISDKGGSEETRSTKLNLPFDSPKAESGLLNCYALSPLHY